MLTQIITKLDSLIPSLLNGNREVASIWLNDNLERAEVYFKGEEGTSPLFFDESGIYYPQSVSLCFEEEFVAYRWEDVIQNAPNTEAVLLEIKQELKDNHIIICSESEEGFLKWW